MINFARIAAVGAVVASFAVAAPAFAQAVSASPKAVAKAQIVKPIVFKKMDDLNFGTIVMGTISGSSSVTINRTAGAVAVCGTNLTCSGVSLPARYNVRTIPNQPLTVRSSPSLMTLAGTTGTTAVTISFVPNAPATVTVPNASVDGHDFYVGGSIAITPTTAEGMYSGEMDVTLDYN